MTYLLAVYCLGGFGGLKAQALFKGRVTDENNRPLPYAQIRVPDAENRFTTAADGTFAIPLVPGTTDLSLLFSYVGKEPVVRRFSRNSLATFQVIQLQPLTLRLPEVQVSSTQAAAASNSSINFGQAAIASLQALSLANVFNYLPGQTILNPVVSIQGNQVLNVRSASQPATIQPLNNGEAADAARQQQLNEAFGFSLRVDGNTLNNNANMQASNPGFLGMFSANNVQHPENGVIRDRSQRNGTLYSSYGAAGANNGFDLRQVPAENIENIEVITGVASARYGDYTSGVAIIDRQAGITPLSVSLRNAGGATYNAGISKGLSLSPALGVINLNLDYLTSNDDPRDKLKAFQRIGGGLIWTYGRQRSSSFLNTLSVDYSTVLDQTRLDPDLLNQRMSRFRNNNLLVSNRTRWSVKKKWLSDVQLQLNYNRSRQESYDQYYLNSTGVIGVASSLTTRTYEGYFAPGYFLAYHNIIGEPVSAGARLQANSYLRLGRTTLYHLNIGAEYNYSVNKGPGVLNNIDQPRFSNVGGKNDRARPFSSLPAQHNSGVFLENELTGKLLGKSYRANIGARADLQNGFFNISPRINTRYDLTRRLSINLAYGIATKAPAISQVSPGNVYFDIPLLSVYAPPRQLYLVHTEVVDLEKIDLRPYKSITAEGGLTYKTAFLNAAAYYFYRRYNDGFGTVNTLVPVTTAQYNYTLTPTGVDYAPAGTTVTRPYTYGRMANCMQSTSRGVEFTLSTRKIKAIQTDFNVNTAWYRSYYRNTSDDVEVPSVIDYSKAAIIGIFSNQEAKAETIKSTIRSTTHIPALRMMITLTGEIFWKARTETLPTSLYPTAYYDQQYQRHELTPAAAASGAYAHLRKPAVTQSVIYTPPFVYPNVHLTLAKEISDVLKMAVNAYNVLNIRPAATNPYNTSVSYFNGQPSFSAQLLLRIK